MARISDPETVAKNHPDAQDEDIRDALKIVKELRGAGLVRSGYGLVSPYEDRRINGKTPRTKRP
jgi:hypothetical protein